MRSASADWLSEPISSASSSSSGKIFCKLVTTASLSSFGLIVSSAISRKATNRILSRSRSTVNSAPPEISRPFARRKEQDRNGLIPYLHNLRQLRVPLGPLSLIVR